MGKEVAVLDGRIALPGSILFSRSSQQSGTFLEQYIFYLLLQDKVYAIM